MDILKEVEEVLTFCERSYRHADEMKHKAQENQIQIEVRYQVGKMMAYEDVAIKLIELKKKLENEA